MPKALLSGGFARCVLALLLVAVAGGAPMVPAALLPDPTWLGGFYDAADEDDILLLVWDQSSSVVLSVVVVYRLTWAYLPAVPSAPLAPVSVRATADSRAPPFAA